MAVLEENKHRADRAQCEQHQAEFKRRSKDGTVWYSHRQGKGGVTNSDYFAGFPDTEKLRYKSELLLLSCYKGSLLYARPN